MCRGNGESRPELLQRVRDALAGQPIVDMHTHCFAPAFGHSAGAEGGPLLWGIDELVTYHYLVAEVFRVAPASELPYDRFWAMSTSERADHIWRELFVERTPVSEACRGVLTTLQELGLDPNERTLAPYRGWFAQQEVSEHIDRVMELSGVERITMTNEVFDERERSLWLDRPGSLRDPRFDAVLRIDKLVRDWPAACADLSVWGYGVRPDLTGGTVGEVRRFLGEWIDRMRAVYVATSLPPGFRWPAGGGAHADAIIERALLPELAERGLPWAMMIGSELRVNPPLRDAGDMVGKADVGSVVRLCAARPRNRFLVTMLSRENQHELCVAARKFGNLTPFGCWWFLNNPSIIGEITRERLELLGTSFVPQHSDARVLEQLVYKWSHSRELIAEALSEQYTRLEATGFRLTDAHIRADADRLMRSNFLSVTNRGARAGGAP